jgi:NADH-quinone oxidoreductase subunit J
VYAGAIMVLFIFSIMLLNLSNSENDFKQKPKIFIFGLAIGLSVFAFIANSILTHFQNHSGDRQLGIFTPQVVSDLGGNSKVLSHALFSQFYVSFEVISLALLVAVVGAVVLAKRKID